MNKEIQKEIQEMVAAAAATTVETRQWASEVLQLENDAWREVLGRNVDIAPLPSIVTPEVKRNLEHLGLGLRFIPKMDIGTLDILKKKGTVGYLDELQSLYPGWKRYESLSNTERRYHSVGRNLNEWYWNKVECGHIDFPRLPGVWVAVETMPKPSCGDKYEKTAITDRLRLPDRFGVAWNNAQTAIQRAKRPILLESGLPGSLDVRMLEALEWNLLANREGWGATNTYEWTNTKYRKYCWWGDFYRVFIGCSTCGGAARAGCFSRDCPVDVIGFRLAVILDSRSLKT